MEKIKCKQCKKEFFTKKHNVKYCSIDCRDMYNKRPEKSVPGEDPYWWFPESTNIDNCIIKKSEP